MSATSHYEEFGHYTLLHRIAVSGMSEIFLAQPKSSDEQDKIVVVKRMKESAINDPEMVKMFVDEEATLGRMDHPSIIRAVEFGKAQNRYFIVLEHVWGESLTTVCGLCHKLGLAFPMDVALYIGAEVAAALGHAHTRADPDGRPAPIIHRDVTINNIMLTYDGGIKVVDFGLAKTAGRLAHTTVGQVKGTLVYLAPEQLIEGKDGPQTDIYQLGVLLYKLTVGREPIAANSMDELVDAVMKGGIVKPRKRVANFPKRVEMVLLTALAHKPQRRFGTADQFAAALRDLLPSSFDDGKAKVADLMKRLAEDRRRRQVTMLRSLLRRETADPENQHLFDRSSVEDEPKMVPAEISGLFQRPDAEQEPTEGREEAEALLPPGFVTKPQSPSAVPPKLPTPPRPGAQTATPPPAPPTPPERGVSTDEIPFVSDVMMLQQTGEVEAKKSAAAPILAKLRALWQQLLDAIRKIDTSSLRSLPSRVGPWLQQLKLGLKRREPKAIAIAALPIAALLLLIAVLALGGDGESGDTSTVARRTAGGGITSSEELRALEAEIAREEAAETGGQTEPDADDGTRGGPKDPRSGAKPDDQPDEADTEPPAQTPAEKAADQLEALDAIPAAERSGRQELKRGHALVELGRPNAALSAYAQAINKDAHDRDALDFTLDRLGSAQASQAEMLLVSWPGRGVDKQLSQLAKKANPQVRTRAQRVMDRREQARRKSKPSASKGKSGKGAGGKAGGTKSAGSGGTGAKTDKAVEERKQQAPSGGSGSKSAAIRGLMSGETCEARKRSLEVLAKIGDDAASLKAIQQASKRMPDNFCMYMDLTLAEGKLRQRLR